MHRAATSAGRASPDSVMDCYATNGPLPTRPTCPVEEAPDVPMEDADAPEYSFYQFLPVQ
jgi:hypothetical protein